MSWTCISVGSSPVGRVVVRPAAPVPAGVRAVPDVHAAHVRLQLAAAREALGAGRAGVALFPVRRVHGPRVVAQVPAAGKGAGAVLAQEDLAAVHLREGGRTFARENDI